MAVLSKNGTEVGRIETMTRKYSFRSNGKIMVNSGDGWRMCHNGKKFADIEATYREELERHESRPGTMKDFEREFKQLFSPQHRVVAKAMFDLLHDDPDGLCSEMQDARLDVELCDVVHLCDLWSTYLADREMCTTAVTKDVHDGRHILGIYSNRIIARQHAAIHAAHEKSLGYSGRIRLSRATGIEISAYIMNGNTIH